MVPIILSPTSTSLYCTIDFHNYIYFNEFFYITDAAKVTPLMMAIGECGAKSLLKNVSDTLFLSQFIKIISNSARTESTIVNNVLLVIDKMLKHLENIPSGSHYDKIRNMVKIICKFSVHHCM